MTASSTLPRITCPAWCTRTEQEHQDDLDGWEGRVLHRSDYDLDDWCLASTSAVDGQAWPDEDDEPVMLMHGDQPVSPTDAERQALALLELVKQARS